VAVLHDLTHVQRFADFVMAMRDGRIAAMGETREMMQPDVLREVFEIEVSV
jgi:iron complex transport system ATP-binding protein